MARELENQEKIGIELCLFDSQEENFFKQLYAAQFFLRECVCAFLNDRFNKFCHKAAESNTCFMEIVPYVFVWSFLCRQCVFRFFLPFCF